MSPRALGREWYGRPTAKFFAEETVLWSKVIKQANIEPQ